MSWLELIRDWLTFNRWRKLAGLAAVGLGLFLFWFARGARQPLVSGLLTHSQFQTLSAISDTFVPSDAEAAKAYPDDPIMRSYFLRKASDIKTAEVVCFFILLCETCA